MSIKTVTIDGVIHVVTYQCLKNAVCGKLVPLGASFLERKSLWETTCNKCKKILSPLK